MRSVLPTFASTHWLGTLSVCCKKRCVAVAPRWSWTDFPLRAKSTAANKFCSWLLGLDSAKPFFFLKEKVLTTVCLTDSSCVSSGAAGRLTREKCDIDTALKGDSFWFSFLNIWWILDIKPGQRFKHWTRSPLIPVVSSGSSAWILSWALLSEVYANGWCLSQLLAA